MLLIKITAFILIFKMNKMVFFNHFLKLIQLSLFNLMRFLIIHLQDEKKAIFLEYDLIILINLNQIKILEF